MSKKKLFMGAHMSIAGGFEKGIERGALLGCTAIQIFTKSNRQWRAHAISHAQETLFKSAKQNFQIGPIIAHASYLINIAAASSPVLQQSISSLIQELARCTQLDIPYLVLHPGSHTGLTKQEAIKQIVSALDYVFSQDTGGQTTILLENMAGQGSQVGDRFEQLGMIIRSSRYSNRLGVCFDTCHAHAAGYDFTQQTTYDAMWKEFDALIGLDKLRAIHLNDSKKLCGSRLDRHEHIGQGTIGLEAFRLLCNDRRFFHIPKILETPKKHPNDDTHNMDTIVGLLSAENRKYWDFKREQ